jgi:virginiamycin A acetyltransferase
MRTHQEKLEGLEVCASAYISPLADLEPSVRGSRIVIGADSMIDSFVKIKPAGGLGDVILGQRVYINSGCVLYIGNGIRIGDDVLIAANCTLAPVNHAYADKTKPIRLQGFGENRGGIIIEDDVWIGANCVLLDGSVLRRGCVVGAGSLVRGEYSEYSICMGRPAKVVGMRQ